MIPLTMNAVDLHRKARLRELIDTRFKGSRVDFCAESGISQSRLTQLLDEKDPFGERVARKIAGKLRIGNDRWFDLPPGAVRQLAAVEKRDDRFFQLFELPVDVQEALLTIIQNLSRAHGARRVIES